MSRPLVVITVFGNSANEVCLISGCGAQITSAQMAGELSETLTGMFGDRVQVHYLDVADPEIRAKAVGVAEGARQRHLPYPLIAIDGQVVLAGKADAESVLRKLDEVLNEGDDHR
jgi:disulfide oxidoreductase YuzD